MEEAKCLYLMGVEDDDFACDFDPLSVSDISLPNVTVDQDLNNGLEEIIELRIMNGEDQVKVHKSKFVCRVCMNAYQEGQVLIMTKCDCKYILIHQECQIEWSKNTGNCKCCDACKQEIRNITVILSETIKETFIPSPKCCFMIISQRMLQNPRVEMEEEFLIVKVKTPHVNVVGQQDEKVHKEEAICRSCYDTFNEDNVVKRKCDCSSLTLLHEECAKKLSDSEGNNFCDVCEQDGQDIPVLLTVPQLSSPSTSKPSRSRKKLSKRANKLFRAINGRLCDRA